MLLLVEKRAYVRRRFFFKVENLSYTNLLSFAENMAGLFPRCFFKNFGCEYITIKCNPGAGNLRVLPSKR
jgi:hypothetical protein